MLDRQELEQLLDTMTRSGGSALHLMAGRAPCLRLQGKLIASSSGTATAEQLWRLVEELVPADQMRRLASGEEVHTLHASASGVCYRNTITLDENGPNLLFRRVAESALSFEGLGLPEVIGSLACSQRGLVLVTGFHGSGKSTTLAAMVDRVNRGHPAHVVTVEARIDHLHASEHGIVHQREVGRHVSSFAAGVREARLLGADVVMVGDVPDLATLLAILDAAERGMCVLAEVQASGVVGALEKLVASAPESARERVVGRLARSLRAVIAQTLLQKSHGSGRIPVLEVVIANQAVRRAIVAGNLHELPRIMERGRGLGMQTVDRGLKNLLNSKSITLDEALYHALDRDWLFRK
jgi:twitching motility protein PilT